MAGQLLDNDELKEIASKYGKSMEQYIIHWDIQINVITISKSAKEHRIIENADVFDFELTKDDMSRINHMNKNQRIGPDPDNYDF